MIEYKWYIESFPVEDRYVVALHLFVEFNEKQRWVATIELDQSFDEREWVSGIARCTKAVNDARTKLVETDWLTDTPEYWPELTVGEVNRVAREIFHKAAECKAGKWKWRAQTPESKDWEPLPPLVHLWVDTTVAVR